MKIPSIPYGSHNILIILYLFLITLFIVDGQADMIGGDDQELVGVGGDLITTGSYLF